MNPDTFIMELFATNFHVWTPQTTEFKQPIAPNSLTTSSDVCGAEFKISLTRAHLASG